MRDAVEKQKRIEPLQPNGRRRGNKTKKEKKRNKIGEKSKDSRTTPKNDDADDERHDNV